MNKAKQYLIGLLCGMGPDHVMMKDIKVNSDLGQDLVRNGGITKEDLLSTGANGRCFFEFPEAWASLPRLKQALEDNGERLESADFMRSIMAGKSLVKMAEELNVLDHAFSSDIWAGRACEMERAWFALEKAKRDKFDFLSVRRALAHQEGRALREDQLAASGLTKLDMRSAIRDGKFEKVRDKLAANGDRMCPEDLLLMDDYGDNAMDNTAAWINAEKTFTELLAQGAHFEPEHFLYRGGNGKNILIKAFDGSNNGARHIFNAKIWAGRPEAVLTLYEHVPADKKSQVPLVQLIGDIYDDMYGKLVDVNDLSAQDLVTPLNADEQGGVLPLGLKTIWNAMPEIREILAKSGQAIDVDFLRRPSGILRETCMMQAVRFGRLDQVMGIMADNGKHLSLEDLTAKQEGQSETLLQLICKANQQAALLQPSHWVGRGQELLGVWNAMSESERKGVDFKQIHSEMNRLTLRQRFGGGRALTM